MNTKQSVLLVVALILIGFIFYQSKDWFRPDDIQIVCTVRPNLLPEQRAKRLGPAIKDHPYTVSFAFNQRCRLKSLKVLNVSELATNRFAHPLWELRSDSNSIPVKAITYGIPIRGLRPPIRGAQAEPLVPGVPYRLLLETTDQEIACDFKVQRR